MNEKDTDLNVKVVPWSATQEAINAHSQTLLQHASIQEHLKGARYRIFPSSRSSLKKRPITLLSPSFIGR